MKFRSGSTSILLGCATLAACFFTVEWAKADSTGSSNRFVYNPITGKSVPRQAPPARAGVYSTRATIGSVDGNGTPSALLPVTAGPARRIARSSSAENARISQPSTLTPDADVNRIEPIGEDPMVFPDLATRDGAGCDGACDGSVAFNAECCDTGSACDCGKCCICLPRGCWTGGAEAVFLKPRYENNAAFTVMMADGATFETFSDTEFNYDLEVTPRVWIGRSVGDGIGWRAMWWQFDHEPAVESVQPPANGFGQVTHPGFGDVDISSTIPTDTFSASSMLNIYAIDLEAIKEVSFCNWDLGVGCGLRYASVEQRYAAALRDSDNLLRGQIDFEHAIKGFGPTISLAASRPLPFCGELFCAARASVLFGDGESRLVADEDLDLTTPFRTTRTTSQDDLLSVGEIQVGIRIFGQENPRFAFRSFFSAALEGQIWNGAGNASSAEGDLGLVGLSVGAGISR